ncbi:MAG: DUF2752 domain-containing protein [Bacteroidetes bacterium]|nr:DUF2752 domain-containing protein [Bacteroidota bacterium]
MENVVQERKAALLIAWAILSVLAIFILLFPLVADKETVLRASPVCISKSQFNTECSFCGMTRAFIDITNGSFSAAWSLNKGSLFLYSLFLVNSILFLIFSVHRLFKILPVYSPDSPSSGRKNSLDNSRIFSTKT